MRYHFSFNVPSRVILGLLGSGPRQSWIDIRPDEVHGQLGWMGDVTIPRVSIVSVERVDRVPWWLGLGLHGFFGTWAFKLGIGSGDIPLAAAVSLFLFPLLAILAIFILRDVSRRTREI